MAKSKLEKREAQTIAAKIGALVSKDGAHQRALFYFEGKLILKFGIRHSRKSGQGHLIGELGPLKLNETKALALARCTLTKEQYVQILKDKGFIPS